MLSGSKIKGSWSEQDASQDGQNQRKARTDFSIEIHKIGCFCACNRFLIVLNQYIATEKCKKPKKNRILTSEKIGWVNVLTLVYNRFANVNSFYQFCDRSNRKNLKTLKIPLFLNSASKSKKVGLSFWFLVISLWNYITIRGRIRNVERPIQQNTPKPRARFRILG